MTPTTRKAVVVTLLLHTIIQGFSQTTTDSRAAEILAMSNIGSCRAGAYMPNGKEVVFISNMSGSPQVWKVSSSGGWPVQLTGLTDPVTAMSPSPAGDLIALLVAPGGGLNTQIYVMDSNGRNLKQITKGGKSNNFFGTWSKDGMLLSFGSNEQNPTGVDFFIYDVRNDNAQLVVKNKGLGGIADFSPDNKRLLLTKLVSRGSNDLYSYNVDTKEETLLTPHTGPGTFFGAISKSGDIYLASNKDRDLIAFARYNDNTIEIIAEKTEAELSDFELNASGTLAALIWNESGRNKVTLFDLKQRKEVKTLKLPVELVSAISFSPDDKSMIFTGQGSKEPQNVWSYDFAADTFSKITDSPHPGVDLSIFVAPELVTFKSFDGVVLSGWLYKPKNGAGPFPTVISYHGGPEGQSVPNFSVLAQLFVRDGIAFFLPNVRGSAGFGKKFVNLDNGPLRVNGVKDIKGVSDYLIGAGISRKDKLGIIGGSYGGYMVMAGVTEYPEMFAAGANLFGIVNFETFFKHTEPWMAAISTVEYGDPVTQNDMLRQLSPIHKVQLVRTPLLVQHGANDTNVPVVEAEQVVESLKKNNVPVHYTLFPDEGHGWQKTSNRIRSNVEIVEWFAKYLK